MSCGVKLLQLLSALEDAKPAKPGAHAVILVHRVPAGEKQLALVVRVSPACSKMLYLDHADLDKPVPQLLSEIISMLPEAAPL